MTTKPIQANAPTFPANLSAERGAISIIAQNYETLDAAKWDEDLFFSDSHRRCFRAAVALHREGRKADFFSLQGRLQSQGDFADADGECELMAIWTAYPVPDIQTALEHRKDLLKARRYRNALRRTGDLMPDIRSMQADLSQLADLATDSEEEDTNAPTLKTQCMALLDELESMALPETFGTGVSHLDKLLGGGFRRGRVGVVSSETSGGKSILLVQIATRACSDGKNGLFFSLEMSAQDIIARMSANISGVTTVPASHRPTTAHVNSMHAAIRQISKFGIEIHDQVTGIDEIESMCRVRAKKGDLDWVVVDYLQLCQSPGDSSAETREQQVSEVMRRLKILALNLNILVLTASQLNDKGELRESRAIGHHTDYVLHIDHSGDAVIHLAKNRNGERHVFAPVVMQGAISRFVERTQARA